MGHTPCDFSCEKSFEVCEVAQETAHLGFEQRALEKNAFPAVGCSRRICQVVLVHGPTEPRAAGVPDSHLGLPLLAAPSGVCRGSGCLSFAPHSLHTQ